MATSTTRTNKPILPRGNDQSPLAFNRAKLYSGKALDFDGVNDKIDVSFAFSGNTTSISFYLNWDAYGTSNVQFVCESQTGSTFMVHLGGGAGTNGIRFSMSGTTFDSPNAILSGYNHYTLTTDNTTASLYVNGKLFNSKSVSLGSAVTTSLAIAYRSDGNILFLNGQLSGFKIFNTALTAAQVADLYNNPEKIVPTGVEDTALKLWLPMMEGAGTTAYDGSGNGNHGTISGATYVHGVGSPVAQSAVIDWNKDLNYVNEYSEDFSDAGWQNTGSTISASSESNPYGKQTWEFEVTSLPAEVQIRGNVSGALNTSTAFKTIVIAKAGTLDWLRVRNLFMPDGGTNGNVWFNLSTGSVGTEQSGQTGTMTALGDGWYKCEVSGTTGVTIPNRLLDIGFTDRDGWNEPLATGGTGFLVLSSISLNGIYVQTLGVDQTSPVLLPQGLTSGRDITGVNLFKNVRKQGALNLDGNSWAGVHRNESIEGVSSVTFECWYYFEESIVANSGHIMGKRGYSGSWLRLYSPSANRIRFERDAGEAINASSLTYNNWYHIVGTIDESDNAKLYINGVLKDSKSSFTPWGLDNAAPFSIGAWANTYTDIGAYSTNQLAQPRIYNRALTAEEVQRNYDAGKNIYTNS